jgi:hypothetical protein
MYQSIANGHCGIMRNNMFKDILSKISEIMFKLSTWYVDRVQISWKREIRRLGRRNGNWIWIGLCILFTFILLPILTKEAFHIGFLLGLSFIWSSILAVSFAYILRNPLVMILVYVGVVFGREIMSVFTSAKEEAINGNVIGAIIICALGVYLLLWANRLKKGELEYREK